MPSPENARLPENKASLTEREGRLWAASEEYMRGEIDLEQLERIETHLNEPLGAMRRSYEEHMTWRIRWYLIISITMIYSLALVIGIVGFVVTKDPRYLLFITPTVLVPYVKYLIPMDQREYKLKMAKISANKELSEAKLRVQTLNAELRRQQGDGNMSSTAKKQGQPPIK